MNILDKILCKLDVLKGRIWWFFYKRTKEGKRQKQKLDVLLKRIKNSRKSLSQSMEEKSDTKLPDPDPELIDFWEKGAPSKKKKQKIIKNMKKKQIREKYCPTCGSQRCFGQDGWIEGCKHYSNKPNIGTASFIKDYMKQEHNQIRKYTEKIATNTAKKKEELILEGIRRTNQELYEKITDNFSLQDIQDRVIVNIDFQGTEEYIVDGKKALRLEKPELKFKEEGDNHFVETVFKYRFFGKSEDK